MARAIALMLAIFPFTACGMDVPDSEVSTVQSLDVQRYAGRWYEIATFPLEFQSNCACVTANYTVSPLGIGVRNVCRQNGPDGLLVDIRGLAYAPDGNQPGKLKVRFPVPGEAGDYWVFEVADDYSHAVVTDPNRSSLWILSRDRVMPTSTMDGIKARLEAAGFQLSALRMTQQQGCPEDR
jgi:apolipoprotein D and lipocalin family protein